MIDIEREWMFELHRGALTVSVASVEQNFCSINNADSLVPMMSEWWGGGEMRLEGPWVGCCFTVKLLLPGRTKRFDLKMKKNLKDVCANTTTLNHSIRMLSTFKNPAEFGKGQMIQTSESGLSWRGSLQKRIFSRDHKDDELLPTKQTRSSAVHRPTETNVCVWLERESPVDEERERIRNQFMKLRLYFCFKNLND